MNPSQEIGMGSAGRAPRPNRKAMRRLGALMRRFRKEDDGVAAVEFGFIAATMLVMLIGIVDISNAVSQNWRMSQLNRTLADLASQGSTISAGEFNNIFAASAATLSPYTGPMPTMVISSVVINATGQARVCWSVSSPAGAALAPGSPVTLPNAGMATPNSSYIMSNTRMTYQGFISPNFPMDSKALFFRPRQGVVGGPANIEQVVTNNAGPC